MKVHFRNRNAQTYKKGITAPEPFAAYHVEFFQRTLRGRSIQHFDFLSASSRAAARLVCSKVDTNVSFIFCYANLFRHATTPTEQI
ncbi:Uncharacterised protein [Vibrio cholerae]|nr:Uncharacterised protein [Vibrio cholerae]